MHVEVGILNVNLQSLNILREGLNATLMENANVIWHTYMPNVQVRVQTA